MPSKTRHPCDGKRVSLRFKAVTDDAVDRIVRIKYNPEGLGFTTEPSSLDRANVIRFIAEEAAYAVDDFITAQLAAGLSEYALHRVLVNGFRFEFTPCDLRARHLRRGLERERELRIGEAMLAKIAAGET